MLTLNNFLSYIESHKLIAPGNKTLLAVSGGMDSVVMVYLFRQSGLIFSIAHCNFQLRSKESDKDETFTRQLSQQMDVPFYVKRFDTQVYAASKKISIQMAARDLRYGWFEKLRSENKYDYIAIAHHADDHAETILINLTRGTGLEGLKGITVKDKHIIRPLWKFSKDEIIAYCGANKITYREDSSNSETKYIRNKIRKDVLPVLKEINPSFLEGIVQFSGYMDEAADLLEYLVTKELQKHMVEKDNTLLIDIQALQKLPSTRYILYQLLKDYGFKAPVINEIHRSLGQQPGKFFTSSEYSCLRDRQYLIVSPLAITSDHLPLQVRKDEPKVVFAGGIMKFTISDLSVFDPENSDPDKAFFCYDAIKFPLYIRHTEPGDRFIPLGMSGKKKISDYLIDEKVPRTQKQRIWLLCSADKILWVVGMRIDERFKVKDTSSKILIAEFIPHVGQIL